MVSGEACVWSKLPNDSICKLTLSLDHGGTSVMRLSLRITAVAAAVMAFAASTQNVSAQEYIVSSQVVSDEVVGGDCANGNCGGASGDVVSGDMGIAGGARTYGHPHLFYNYYTHGYSNGVNAQMYVSPQPVPPFVGHTFMTYQPLEPHQYLYWHKDTYHNHYDGGRGLNRTRAVYYSPPVGTAVQNVYWNWLRLPR